MHEKNSIMSSDRHTPA